MFYYRIKTLLTNLKRFGNKVELENLPTTD
jgi:hypothetical protein